MFSKATFLGAFTLCMAATGTQSSSFGGRIAADGAHPHQIALKADGRLRCGGAIVAKEWVITTADCVATYEKSPESLTVVVGTTSLSKGGDSYKVHAVYSHQKDDSEDIQNDIAILKVEPFNFIDNVAPILVETENVGGGEPCVLSGWSDKGKLKEIHLTTTTVEYCKNKQDEVILHTNICTKEAEFSCHPDFKSGNPLTREVDGIRRLIGIIVYGTGCTPELPAVYTRISSFVPWLQTKCNNCLN